MEKTIVMNVISKNEYCDLGEGLFVVPYLNIVLWLDINNSKLFFYSTINQSIEVILLSNNPSVILEFNNSQATILDSIGIIKVDIYNHAVTREYTWFKDSVSTRGNDGVKLMSGEYLFGRMKRNPSEKTGGVCLFKEGKLKTIDSIGIPNSFIELEDSILISDSIEQITYKYKKDTFEKTIWKDFSSLQGTPDGGCLYNGLVYLAFWGEACVKVFDQAGIYQNKIDVPALHVTNCKFLGDTMFVTSALEGLDKTNQKMYPLSGCTFSKEF
jgi:sugar lactone lactonase YvrE